MKLRTLTQTVALVGLIATYSTYGALDAAMMKRVARTALKKLGTNGIVAISTVAAILFAQKYLHTHCTISREWLTYGRTPHKPEVRCLTCENTDEKKNKHSEYIKN